MLCSAPNTGNILSIFLVDSLGRRKTACYCLAGACLASLAFAAAPATGAWAVAAACIFNGISVGGWNALDLITTEMFPTEVGAAKKIAQDMVPMVT